VVFDIYTLLLLALLLMSSSSDFVLCPKIVSRTKLTAGDWEVVWGDESRSLVYFHGLKDTYL